MFANFLTGEIMPDPLLGTGTKTTPQDERAHPGQVENNAGGYTFTVADDARLHRFLTLGTENGSYYVSERKLTKENAGIVADWARSRAADLAQHARDISHAGRAPRNNPALYALAAASVMGDDQGRHAALNFLPQVARTGTHLYAFAGYRELFGGWGRGVRRAVGDWYLDKDPDALAYQMVKYRQRNGWSHRDMLRLAHPGTDSARHKMLFDYLCGRNADEELLPAVIHAFRDAWEAERDTGLTETARVHRWIRLIEGMRGGMPWEALPDRAMSSPEVWHALIASGMPQGALLRKLPVITRSGALEPFSETLKLLCRQLTDQEKLIQARIHPMAILIALKTYSMGQNLRGDSTWIPVPQVCDALSDAFYLSYGAVEPANKRTMLALDVSGSMGSMTPVFGLTCREASVAIALVTAATEPDWAITGFTGGSGPSRWGYMYGSGISILDISPRQRLDDAVRKVANLPFGGTDCSLPMQWALKTKTEVDTFEILTDNETWAGSMHPHQALEQYRQKMGIPARLAVTALTATDFSIADPRDPGSLDISGFDSAVPKLLADFSRGDI